MKNKIETGLKHFKTSVAMWGFSYINLFPTSCVYIQIKCLVTNIHAKKYVDLITEVIKMTVMRSD